MKIGVSLIENEYKNLDTFIPTKIGVSLIENEYKNLGTFISMKIGIYTTKKITLSFLNLIL